MVLSLAIFFLTITGVFLRPARLSEVSIVALGAGAMVLFGVVTLQETCQALTGNINVLLFFLGLMVVAAIAETAGIFNRVTTMAVALARGSGRRLLLIIFGIGTIITLLLSNDATALMLTPVVLIMAIRLNLNPLPYAFACAFIANAASILLPMANPVNLLAVDAFDLRLGDYLKHLLLPSLVAISITIGLFLFIFRRELRTAFSTNIHYESEFISSNGKLAVRVSIVLLFIACGYLFFSFKGWPLSVPVIAGAIILLIFGFSSNNLHWPDLRRSISWSILPFIAGLSILVQGLESSGVIDHLRIELVSFFSHGELSTSMATSLGTATSANLINNWPAMMIMVNTLAALPETIAAHPDLPYQAILGAGLGPNITIFGSLSTMLWLVTLRRRGLNVRLSSYFRLGLIITPPAIFGGSLVLFLLS